MPLGAFRPCLAPGCPELVRGAPRCTAHTQKAQADDRQRRGSSADRGYGARWQRERKVFLERNPLCRPCSLMSPPRVTPATVVDHITDHKGDQVLFWDQRNWQPSCAPCHDRRIDAGDFGR